MSDPSDDTTYCADSCGQVATTERLTTVSTPAHDGESWFDPVYELVCADCLRERP